MHEAPPSDITISGVGSNAYALVEGLSTHNYSAIGDIITIPHAALVDIVNAHGSIKLYVDDIIYDGYIIFRPYVDSEIFYIDENITSQGEFESNSNAIRTDYIDVEGAEEFLYTGRTSSRSPQIYGYDENKQPVKLVLAGGFSRSDFHVIYDGTYRYIVACSQKAVESSLQIYFRQRRAQSISESK